jgi:DNA-binding NarL/FixJ family response regulator
MKFAKTDADVAVMDLGLPDGSGADVMWELREANPSVKILVLTSSVDREQIARAVEAGAGGFLHKSVGVGEIVGAIRRLASGEVLIPPEEIIDLLRLAAQKREEWHRQRLAVMKLTRRETEVLEALAEGLDSEGISRRLGVTVETERTHIVNILNKLKAHSRLEAVVIAVQPRHHRDPQPRAKALRWIPGNPPGVGSRDTLGCLPPDTFAFGFDGLPPCSTGESAVRDTLHAFPDSQNERSRKQSDIALYG